MAGATVSNLAPSYRFHYLPGLLRAPQVQPRLRRVREHRLRAPGRLPAGARDGDAGAGPAPRGGRARVVRAGAVRLLDPRRLPELGHRPRLQALAPGQEARALAGRAAGDRVLRRAAPTTASGRSRCSTAPSSCSTAGPSARAACRRPTRSTCPSIDNNESSAVLAAARVQANAAQAVLLGLGTKRAVEPPPLYAFDPDVGRLAVTTPTYNTAVVAVNRGAFPYGGIELARLFDGQPGRRGRRRRATAGLLRRGRPRYAGQDRAGLPARGDRTPNPLELLEPQLGASRRTRVSSRGCASRGRSSTGGISIRTEHRFDVGLHRDRVARERRDSSKTVEVLFPSWGAGARVTAVGTDGSRRSVSGGVVAGRRRVVPRRVRAHGLRRRDPPWRRHRLVGSGRLTVLRAPPGPTLTVELESVMVARIAPARTAEEARTWRTRWAESAAVLRPDRSPGCQIRVLRRGRPRACGRIHTRDPAVSSEACALGARRGGRRLPGAVAAAHLRGGFAAAGTTPQAPRGLRGAAATGRPPSAARMRDGRRPLGARRRGAPGVASGAVRRAMGSESPWGSATGRRGGRGRRASRPASASASRPAPARRVSGSRPASACGGLRRPGAPADGGRASVSRRAWGAVGTVHRHRGCRANAGAGGGAARAGAAATPFGR